MSKMEKKTKQCANCGCDIHPLDRLCEDCEREYFRDGIHERQMDERHRGEYDFEYGAYKY